MLDRIIDLLERVMLIYKMEKSGQCKIFLLSHYLTDKAYDFYTQKVANDEGN